MQEEGRGSQKQDLRELSQPQHFEWSLHLLKAGSVLDFEHLKHLFRADRLNWLSNFDMLRLFGFSSFLD